MTPIDKLIRELPGFEQIEVGEVPAGFWTGIGGATAFGGALRFFASQPGFGVVCVQDWNTSTGWAASYGELAPNWSSISEDAFGNQYLLSSRGDQIAIFWSETGEVEMIEASPFEFVEMIRNDPENTISLPLYQECVARFGRLPLDWHFALRVESAVGGLFEVDNIVPMKSGLHMAALGKLASQLKNMPIGTPLRPVVEEE